MTCDYCKKKVKLIDSKFIYRRSYGKLWFCQPCDAWVGCHKNSRHNAPLGRLANAELRGWKQKAHAVFDPLWRDKIRHGVSKNKARKAAYDWLADQLGIKEKDCHIGRMDVDMCKKVWDACRSIR